jgi:hypothetical protein
VIPSSWRDLTRWQAIVAQFVNPILRGYPFKSLDTDPGNVEAGYTYFNTTSGKVRTWDGAAWNDHW